MIKASSSTTIPSPQIALMKNRLAYIVHGILTMCVIEFVPNEIYGIKTNLATHYRSHY